MGSQHQVERTASDGDGREGMTIGRSPAEVYTVARLQDDGQVLAMAVVFALLYVGTT